MHNGCKISFQKNNSQNTLFSINTTNEKSSRRPQTATWFSRELW